MAASAIGTKPKLQKWIARGMDVAESMPAKKAKSTMKVKKNKR